MSHLNTGENYLAEVCSIKVSMSHLNIAESYLAEVCSIKVSMSHMNTGESYLAEVSNTKVPIIMAWWVCRSMSLSVFLVSQIFIRAVFSPFLKIEE